MESIFETAIWFFILIMAIIVIAKSKKDKKKNKKLDFETDELISDDDFDD